MPRRSTAAKRYAEAVAAIARESGTWQRWRQDLAAIGGALETPGLRTALVSPSLSADVKHGLLDRSIGTGISAEARNLLRVMGRRRRFELLPDVIAWFDEIADRALGVQRVTVATAAPLTDEQRQRLRERLSARGGRSAGQDSGGEVVLAEQVDPDILGGLVIRSGDVIRDYSVRARLEALRQRLN